MSSTKEAAPKGPIAGVDGGCSFLPSYFFHHQGGLGAAEKQANQPTRYSTKATFREEAPKRTGL